LVRVMVVFGGRSGEHEVSLASARAIMEALNGRHEVVPVGITREGRWVSSGDPMRKLESKKGEGTLARTDERLPATTLGSVDVVFPALHGPYGEDGTIQGMLELAGIPYVGSGVLASAVGMDKLTMKKIFAHHGLPQVEWVGLTRKEWEEAAQVWVREVETALGYPCFVKPANLGSSVGITKAGDADELERALDEAARLDRRLIVEAGVDAREIEVSVLGNEGAEVSVPGEIIVKKNEFYDYEAKYSEGGMDLVVPADIPEPTAAEVRHKINQRRSGHDPSSLEASPAVRSYLSGSLPELRELMMRLRIMLAVDGEDDPDAVETLIRQGDRLMLVNRIRIMMHTVHQRLMSLYPEVSDEAVETARRLADSFRAFLDPEQEDAAADLDAGVEDGLLFLICLESEL
jgi:D-alanine-D-alanine ligase